MYIRLYLIVSFFVFTGIGCATLCAPAKDAITVSNPWIRPAKATQNTAQYMTLICKDDKLISASCPLAGYVELHDHIDVEGVMKMRPVAYIKVQGQPVDMKPGGQHVMFFKLKKDFNPGDKVPVTLSFEKAGKIDLLVDVGQP